jgi:hypothetical protein
VTKRFWKGGFGMASSSISLTPDEDVDTTCLNDLISRVTNDDITPDQFISFDDHVETLNTETDIARTVASRSIVDDEEGELEIPEAYNEDVKNSVKSYQEALSMIQQLEEFSKKKECITSLQHLWMVKFEYEKHVTYQCKTVQTKIDNFFKRT